jgi:HAD superfamily hydrolase (TIGR01509 family)
MLKQLHFSAIIFDLDGLVLDTESSYYRAWQVAARELGYHLPDDFAQQITGLHYHDVETTLLAYLGKDFALAEFKQRSSSVWHEQVKREGIAIKHGVIELLAWLQQQQLPYCLATNSLAANARHCLHLAGLTEAFAIIISRSDVAQGKPEPDIFWAAANALQTPIEQCLVLEDSHTGIVAAKRAGAKAVFIPSVLPANAQATALCDVQLNDLAQLLAHLQKRVDKAIEYNSTTL